MNKQNWTASYHEE